MSQHDQFIRLFGHGLRDFRLYAENPSFANPPWREAGFRLLIVRLSQAADVERSTPHLFLAQEVRREMPDAYIDMAFLPCPADQELLRGHGLPLLLGTQSHRSLGEFDLAFLSNSYLLELRSLPPLFAGSGIPLWSVDRGGQWPPIILGGSNASAAHPTVRPDGGCMADALFFGEGEGKACRIAQLVRREAGTPKKALLERIAAEVEGLWPAGGLARETRRAVCRVEEAGSQGLPVPLLPGPEAGTARLAITMGCPSMCSFCFEGHDRKPFREIPLETLLAAARQMKSSTGAETLELASFNFNTHSRLADLLHGLNRIFLRVNLMSQRVDILARTPGLLDLELAADKRSFTLGIEGISARQRRFLSKGVTESDVRRALEALHRARTREVKLFFLLTGSETAQDFAEFAGLLGWLKAVRRASDAPPRMIFSFGLLVRMPFTPLGQDPAILDEGVWRPLVGKAKSACETNGFEFRLAAQWDEYAVTQALAIGGYAAHELLTGTPLETWIARHGARLHASRADGQPFAFLEEETDRAARDRQYRRALAGRDQPHPGETAAATRPAVDLAGITELTDLMRRKHRLKPVRITTCVPREASGFGREWLDAWLLRRLLEQHPDQAGNVLSVREILVGPWAEGLDCPWFGRTLISILAWEPDACPACIDRLPAVPARAGEASPPAEPFASLSVRLGLPRRFFPEPGPGLASFLNAGHVPVTLERAPGSGRYVVAGRALRRRALLAGSFIETEDTTTMELRVGRRFPIAAFLAAAATEASASRRAVLEVTDVEL